MDRRVVHVDVAARNGWRVDRVEVFPRSAIWRVTLVRTEAGTPNNGHVVGRGFVSSSHPIAEAILRLDGQKAMFIDQLPDIGVASKELAEQVTDALHAKMLRDSGRLPALR